MVNNNQLILWIEDQSAAKVSKVSLVSKNDFTNSKLLKSTIF